MEILLIQSKDPSRLCEVYGRDGERLYTVCGQYLGPRGTFGVFGPDGKEAACFRRIGSDSMGYYRVYVGGKEVFSVLKRFIGHRPALQLQGLLWHDGEIVLKDRVNIHEITTSKSKIGISTECSCGLADKFAPL